MNEIIDAPKLAGLILLSLLATSCGNRTRPVEPTGGNEKDLAFEARKIAEGAKHWWAHCPVEVSGDGITDLVYIHSNSSGGYLAFREGRTDAELWEEHIIAEAPPSGGLFASGDMECGDMDGDGDVDVLAVKHPGEWVEAGAPAEIFWYENPGWILHSIGTVPDAVKDLSLADFNGDSRLDLAVMTFDENTLSLFIQTSEDSWERAMYLEQFDNLHEGMGTGDFDGDGDTDIVAGAHIFYNPDGDITGPWKHENLDPLWNTQEGDWSRNATKTMARDLDGDGISEIFLAHSERAGYPIACYRKHAEGAWSARLVLDSIPACHTLQVLDFNLDGYEDVLAGVNAGRAVNIGYDSYEVLILLGQEGYEEWTPLLLSTEGIYNGQAADYDGDGDFDIFRYPHHEATEFFLLENQMVK